MGVLDGEAALVTGASRGIGRAIALELAQAGAAVAVHYRSEVDAANAVIAEIEAAGGRAFALAGDVTEEADVRRVVSETLNAFGRLDVLVCNAGVVRDQLAAAMTLEQWETVLDTNLRGPFFCVREAARPMMAQKKGSIVMLSSIAAEKGSRGHCNYAAAKGGINAMVKALAVELAPKKIRVNAVSPGVVKTDMSRRVRDMASDEILARIPLGRFAEATEVAHAVRFLASDEASYITGEILRVDGGQGA